MYDISEVLEIQYVIHGQDKHTNQPGKELWDPRAEQVQIHTTLDLSGLPRQKSP